MVGGHFGIEAGFQVLGRRPGKPFAAVCVSPDGKRPLARRPDGFYALPAGGGTPAEAFDDLPAVTVLRWSGR